MRLRNDPEKERELEDFEDEINRFHFIMKDLQQNFKKLIKKLDNFPRYFTRISKQDANRLLSLKKETVLCLMHINYQIKCCEEDSSKYWSEFCKYFCSPLHVASKGGFLNLVEVLFKKRQTNSRNMYCAIPEIHLQRRHFQILSLQENGTKWYWCLWVH